VGAESSIGFAQSEPDGREAQSAGSADVPLSFASPLFADTPLVEWRKTAQIEAMQMKSVPV
jgi:hypothetical protein